MFNYHELLFYYPYEYKELQQHFCEMAKRGWILKSMNGNWLWTCFTYERQKPQDIQYYVDFIDDNSSLLWGYNTQKTKKYQSLAEEYGYTYRTGAKEILVFTTEGHEKMELRDESEISLKALRKATRQNLTGYMFMCIAYLFMFFITPIVNIFTGNWFTSYEASSNMMLFSYIARILLLTPMLIMIFPAVRWLINGKYKSRIWVMKMIIYCVLIGFYMMISSLFVSDAHGDIEVLTFLMGLLLLALAAHEVWWRLTRKTSKGICVGLLALGICLSLYSIKDLQQRNTKSLKEPFTPKLLGVKEGVHPYITSSSSFLMSKIDVLYIFDEQEEGTGYTVMIMKDTPLKQYLLDNMPYEYRSAVKKEKREDYIIYDRGYDVGIRKGSIILFVDQVQYSTLTKDAIDAMFQAINEYDTQLM